MKLNNYRNRSRRFETNGWMCNRFWGRIFIFIDKEKRQ